MIRSLQEFFLVELAPKHSVLTKVDGLITQFHRLDALAHVIPVQASRVKQGVAASHVAVPPGGQVGQFREVVLPRQNRETDREVIVSFQDVFDHLGHVLSWGVGLEKEVAAVDVAAHVRKASARDKLTQLAHDDLVLAADVDAAQQSHVLHVVYPVCLS